MDRLKTQMAAPVESMPKALSVITIVLCMLFLFGFALLHILLPDEEFSEMQNRYLEQLPELEAESLLDGDFGEQFDVYLSDQFPALDEWVGLQSTIVRALGVPQNNGVYFAADDYLIEQFHSFDSRTLRRSLSAIAEFAEYSELPVNLCIVPNAVWALEDKLPIFAPDVDQRALLDYIAETMDEGVDVINCFNAMGEHSGEYIYYRTDHHYTTLGAFYVYEALMEHFGEKPLPISVQSVATDSFEGTMQAKSGVWKSRPDTIALMTEGEGFALTRLGEDEIFDNLYFLDALETKDKYNVFLGGNSGIITIKKGTGKKLLMIKDSYAHSIAPFLMAHYGEIHLLDPRYYKLSALDYASEHDFDEVLIFYNMANFATDTNISRLAM